MSRKTILHGKEKEESPKFKADGGSSLQEAEEARDQCIKRIQESLWIGNGFSEIFEGHRDS